MTARKSNIFSNTLADAGQRELILKALDQTLLVEAAAGTGKTTALIGRIVAVLATGHAELDRIVAVTFGDPAAGELKLRLRAELEKARLDEARPLEERDRLGRALPKLEEARVSTIHGFCADLLREHPIEAAVDPYFEVADSDVSRMIIDRVFDRWFEGQLETPGPAVQRILRRRTRDFGTGPQGPRGALRSAAGSLIDHRDFSTPWRIAAAFNRDEVIDEILAEMKSMARWATRCNPRDNLCQSLMEIARAVEEVERNERDRARDYEYLEGYLPSIAGGPHWNRRPWSHPDDPDFPQQEMKDRREALHARLKNFVEDSGSDIAPRLRDELWPIVEGYEIAKQEAGCLDFMDLLIYTRNLLRDDKQVRRDLQEQFTNYFVDEFQDTDPLQAEILMLLAADDPDVTDWRMARAVPGKLFLVGDPKQSIYRFRRADVRLYRDVHARLVAQGARAVPLTVSFRSVPEIQEAVNAAFRPRFMESERVYVPLDRYRESAPSQPAVIALPVPAPYTDYGWITKGEIDASLPNVVAAWIDWLIKESGWTVTERDRPDERVKVEPRHVCLLFKQLRSFGKDLTRPFVESLEAHELPHLLVGGGAFYSREEIETVSAALMAIERPDDELAVFATLRGPLFALSDASLLLWRERIARLHPFSKVSEDAPAPLTEVAEALKILKDLHRRRNWRPVADTVTDLLEATRAHASFATWPTGMQALANIGRFTDLARRAESQGLISFRAFVEQLERQADTGDIAEAPLMEEGVQGVRIMSAHKSKGLEFSIVVLADLNTNDTHQHPSRWTDSTRGLCVQRLAGCSPPELREHARTETQSEREEAVRLLYVASTRARDALVVPVIGDQRREGWLAPLHPSMYPQPAQARRPEANQAPGTPVFGADTVSKRPDKAKITSESVMPGVHIPEAGQHRVIWWDPRPLKLELKLSLGVAQEKLLIEDVAGKAVAARSLWESWRTRRAEIISRGQKLTRTVQSATERARSSADISGSEEVSIIDARWSGPRPGGARFGTLVHALLAVVSLSAERQDVLAHAEIHARLLGATDAEREAAVDVATSALAQPLLRRAAAANAQGLCRRETPILIRLEDQTLVECVTDLAFKDAEEWVVVDFKTDGELGAQEARYRRQVALYVRGIAEATALKSRGHLLLL